MALAQRPGAPHGGQGGGAFCLVEVEKRGNPFQELSSLNRSLEERRADTTSLASIESAPHVPALTVPSESSELALASPSSGQGVEKELRLLSHELDLLSQSLGAKGAATTTGSVTEAVFDTGSMAAVPVVPAVPAQESLVNAPDTQCYSQPVQPAQPSQPHQLGGFHTSSCPPGSVIDPGTSSRVYSGYLVFAWGCYIGKPLAVFWGDFGQTKATPTPEQCGTLRGKGLEVGCTLFFYKC